VRYAVDTHGPGVTIGIVWCSSNAKSCRRCVGGGPCQTPGSCEVYSFG
jgi:hypothetical protein